jgi:predicted anti-sigma-YlaC factor YlaD
VRCSSCEPLLDAYLEAALRPRDTLTVAAHLRDCSGCSGLLSELRVVDALLATARPPEVAADITPAVVSATHATPPDMPRRPPLGFALLLYLAIAWTFVALAALRWHDLTRVSGIFFALQERGLAVLGFVARILNAPATLVVAAVVTIVLVIDVLLLLLIYSGYRRVRPAIAPHLGRGRRP